MTEATARAHVDRFNTAVLTRDWSAFMATFHDDAVMTFAGPPVGPFVGRAAIAAAYATDPPGDTMRVLSVRVDGDVDVVAFAWSRGGTGVIQIRRSAGLITSLLVSFG